MKVLQILPQLNIGGVERGTLDLSKALIHKGYQSFVISGGGILVDENFKEKDRFNLRCSLPEGEIFQAMALIVNKTSIKQLTQTNLSHYQMLGEVEKIFKKWLQIK